MLCGRTEGEGGTFDGRSSNSVEALTIMGKLQYHNSSAYTISPCFGYSLCPYLRYMGCLQTYLSKLIFTCMWRFFFIRKNGSTVVELSSMLIVSSSCED